MNYDTAEAVACLTSVFLDLLEQRFPTLESFEDEVISIGHSVMLQAMVASMELFDDSLCDSYAPGATIKDKYSRILATRIGDTCFERRICTDQYGNSVVPLDEVLDLPMALPCAMAAQASQPSSAPGHKCGQPAIRFV